MTRSGWPAWRLPFPTLPTITGRRRASRMARRQHRTAQRALKYLPQPNGAMREHARLMALTPEQAATDGQDG